MPVDLAQAQLVDFTVFADKFLAHDAVIARVLVVQLEGFFLSVISFEDTRHFRPGVICGTGMGQAGHDLDLFYAFTALPYSGCYTVGAGIAAADDDNVFPFGGDRFFILELAVQKAFRNAVQIVLGKVDALQLAAWDRQIARYGTACAEGDRVELFEQHFRRNFVPDFAVQLKFDTGGFQQLDAPFNQLFIQFHIGYAVHQKSAGAVGPFVDSDAVAGLIELVGTGQPGRTTADDGNFFAAADRWEVGFDVTFCKGCFDDILFKITDADRTAGQAGAAGSFAGSGTDVRGEFREIIGFIQAGIGKMVQSLINEVVEFRHQVMQRTA